MTKRLLLSALIAFVTTGCAYQSAPQRFDGLYRGRIDSIEDMGGWFESRPAGSRRCSCPKCSPVAEVRNGIFFHRDDQFASKGPVGSDGRFEIWQPGFHITGYILPGNKMVFLAEEHHRKCIHGFGLTQYEMRLDRFPR